MNQNIVWFNTILNTSIAIYFQQNNCECQSLNEILPPDDGWLERIVEKNEISLYERAVIMLAMTPHICPQMLDIFFTENKNTGRPYTEFGGWKGTSHGGFLPTGETAAFILAGENIEHRKAVIQLFDNSHWFYKKNILHLEGAGNGEPLLSGQLRISEEVLCRALYDKEFKPNYSTSFPAKLIETELNWEDLILDYQVTEALENINTWITGNKTIMEEWGLKRFLKNGYRALFYGPPGTGKTLAATLLGKRNSMDVYRVDLSMIVSKYIGETEKNLARVFDMAENRNWILFFDEADALFGKRTSTNTSNDRHANQEIAYLLQRVEDFPGTVILASNLKSNIDEAFARRFQSMIYFPMPDMQQRIDLWKQMLPQNWFGSDFDEIIREAARTEISGGNIANFVRRCAIYLLSSQQEKLTKEVFFRLKNQQ